MIQTKKRAGFTLFEILIVMSILAFLLLIGITNWKSQIQNTFDAKRKGDLSKLKTALEHYTNDHGCYPTANLMTCTSTIFASYNMPKVLCDPEGGQPYYYELVDETNACSGYRIYTHIKNKTDTDITKVGCNAETGCGVTDHPEYNYGVSSGSPVTR